MQEKIDCVIQDLEELKELLIQGKPIPDSFHQKYNYSSSDESLKELLLCDQTQIRIIAKLLIQECTHELFDEELLKRIEEIHRFK